MSYADALSAEFSVSDTRSNGLSVSEVDCHSISNCSVPTVIVEGYSNPIDENYETHNSRDNSSHEIEVKLNEITNQVILYGL